MRFYKTNGTMKRMMKWTGLAGLILMLAACEAIEDTENNANERVRQIPVETITIQPGSFEEFIRVGGVTEAVRDAQISAESSGRIQSVVERGTVLRQGDVIAEMDDRLSRAQHQAAKTVFELADDTYRRMRTLYEDEVISTQDYLNAQAQRDQARAQLDQAEKQLQDAHIQAPFDGRVEERFVRSGELINPGMPVVRLVDINPIRITAGIPERFVGEISEGSLVQTQFRALEIPRFETQITYAGNVIDSATRTYPVEIELENLDGRIKPEMVVDLRVKRRTIEDAVIIPRTAVIRDETGLFVFLVVEENGVKVADLVPIRTGSTVGSLVEVVDGLNEGDEVVISGISLLSIGDRLNILNNTDSDSKARSLQRQEFSRSSIE